MEPVEKPQKYGVVLVHGGLKGTAQTVHILKKIFSMSTKDACRSVAYAHRKGPQTVFTSSKDIAETKASWANAQRNVDIARNPNMGFVSFEVEPVAE